MAISINKLELFEKIVEGSGKPPMEVTKLIDERKKRFSGLLTDEGAAFMVAKELGVKLDYGRLLEFAQVAELKAGQNNVNLRAEAKQIFAPKKFEKDGKKGVLQSIVVADESGEIRLTIWHRDVQRLEEMKVEKGAKLLLKGCYVSTYKDKPQLNLGYGGELIVEKPAEAQTYVKLNALSVEMQNVDAVGRIARVFDEKQFQSETRSGNLRSFVMADETANVRCVAWNEMAEEIAKLGNGDLVKIEGGYVKEGMNGIELHLGWMARVLKEPKNVQMAELAELSGGIPSVKKAISELNDLDENVEIIGKLIAVNRGNLFFNVCGKCGKKVERMEDGFVCSNCGEVKEPDIKLLLSVELEDASGSCRVVLFGNQAEKVMGLNKNALREQLKETNAEDFVMKLNERLIGKRFKAVGRAKESTVSGQIELIANEIREFGFAEDKEQRKIVEESKLV